MLLVPSVIIAMRTGVSPTAQARVRHVPGFGSAGTMMPRNELGSRVHASRSRALRDRNRARHSRGAGRRCCWR